MYCPNCKCEVNSSVQVFGEVYPVKGEDVAIEAHVRFCDRCGEGLLDEELDSQNLLAAFAEYRKRHGLLQPAEIRAVREKYGLSQEGFARVLGFEDNAIARFERGTIADPAENNLIVLAQDTRNFELLLAKNMAQISFEDYEVARAALARLQ